MPELCLRPMERGDWPAVAALIHRSTNAWYERHGRAPVFACEPGDVELFCRVYEALDPGCCVLAELSERGARGDPAARAGGSADAAARLVGSCFYHPRPTHVSLGIMNADPESFGRGVARRLLAHVVAFAERQGKPVRLVSSAMNLDSFSLYNRAGFRPYGVHQDMTLRVPDEGFAASAGASAAASGAASGAASAAASARVRPAHLGDAVAMAALELEIGGIQREKDYRYFLQNEEGIWHASVCEGRADGLDGFLVSVSAPASDMLGPGVMRDDEVALALIAAELEQHRGRSPVWLAPSDRPGLLARLYAWGARNCELHLAQALGGARRPAGVVMPTFMPETG